MLPAGKTLREHAENKENGQREKRRQRPSLHSKSVSWEELGLQIVPAMPDFCFFLISTRKPIHLVFQARTTSYTTQDSLFNASHLETCLRRLFSVSTKMCGVESMQATCLSLKCLVTDTSPRMARDSQLDRSVCLEGSRRENPLHVNRRHSVYLNN